MYHWEFDNTTGRYALFDGERPMSVNPPPGTITGDMKRIARALNIEAAMGEVREALDRILQTRMYVDDVEEKEEAYALGEKALAALDRAGEACHAQG